MTTNSKAVAAAASSVEVVVIGAGVVGLAIARALSRRGKEVIVLDRADQIGAETSSRNSEVVHAGLYYPPSSWKAKFCVSGRKLMYEYCDQRHSFFQKCGKLVVATTAEQAQSILPTLYEKAQGNGVTDVELISAARVRDMEPELITCHGAMWSPSTGIVDSHAFMLHLLADAEANGTTLALHTTVTDAKLEQDRVHLLADGVWLSCGAVINSAGLWADKIAQLIHNAHDDHQHWQPPRQYYARGTYFRLKGKSPFSHLIYPVPDPRGGLGVHATMDSSGQVKFGPDVEWLDPDTDPDQIDYTPDPERAHVFYHAIREYWPNLPEDSLLPDYTGVRPKLSHPSIMERETSFQDFSILGPEAHGVNRLFHLLGIESPGLTASMAIADYIAARVEG